ncbi:hypothetical protein KC669_02180 [Candidatus Dojkabacteria bacterium]|uniref:DUF5648 domain-containing protein n=1 Tax=Candidatus Dojkabacteria bacterium TaxID=2099670 RepID=A0A955LAG9_9BACT|nr:hypothetical protein [Candidatus Dojkabacteria bacterium]
MTKKIVSVLSFFIAIIMFVSLSSTNLIKAQGELTTQILLFSKEQISSNAPVLVSIVCRNNSSNFIADHALEIKMQSLRDSSVQKIKNIQMAYTQTGASPTVGTIQSLGNDNFRAFTQGVYPLNVGDSLIYALEINLNPLTVKNIEDFKLSFKCISTLAGDRFTETLDATEPYVDDYISVSSTLEGEKVVYRFFNKQIGSHLYTISTDERDKVLGLSEQWQYEGSKYIVFGTPGEGRVPVYRFFNRQTGAHLYTISEDEKNSILQMSNIWMFEGVKFYVYNVKADSTLTGVYRFFNRVNGSHLFTISTNERDSISNGLKDFSFEGEKYFVKPLD